MKSIIEQETINAIELSVEYARKKHPANSTIHHSLSTIWEEFDELKDELRAQKIDPFRARDEALHLITTTVRLLEEHLHPMIEQAHKEQVLIKKAREQQEPKVNYWTRGQESDGR